jgi:NUMOD4 motif
MCSNLKTDPRTYLIRLRAAIDSMKSDSPECWIELKDNPQYLISNHGRVVNLKSYFGRPRILTPTLRCDKYLFVTLTINQKRKTISLSRLKEIAFMGKIDIEFRDLNIQQ